MEINKDFDVEKLKKEGLAHKLRREILLYNSIALLAGYHEPVPYFLLIIVVKYGCAAVGADIIFLEIVVIELRTSLKPVDGLAQSFKIPLLPALGAFLQFLMHVLFHVLDVALAVFSYSLVVAEIFFAMLKIFLVSCFSIRAFS